MVKNEDCQRQPSIALKKRNLKISVLKMNKPSERNITRISKKNVILENIFGKNPRSTEKINSNDGEET